MGRQARHTVQGGGGARWRSRSLAVAQRIWTHGGRRYEHGAARRRTALQSCKPEWPSAAQTLVTSCTHHLLTHHLLTHHFAHSRLPLQRPVRAQVLALTKLRHAHIVSCVGVLVEPPTFGLVLEYCSGLDLRTTLRKCSTPAGFVLRAASGVASGMVYLHSKGILHRDLKGAWRCTLAPACPPSPHTIALSLHTGLSSHHRPL